MWYEHGSTFARHARKQNSYYHDETVNLLRNIQKKNAFNAIIKWGYYKPEVPGAKSYFDAIKAAYNNEHPTRSFPEWYDFHNGLTGKGVLFSLPNIRGEKEDTTFS